MARAAAQDGCFAERGQMAGDGARVSVGQQRPGLAGPVACPVLEPVMEPHEFTGRPGVVEAAQQRPGLTEYGRRAFAWVRLSGERGGDDDHFRRGGAESAGPVPVGVDLPVMLYPAAMLLDDELLAVGRGHPGDRGSYDGGHLARPKHSAGSLAECRQDGHGVLARCWVSLWAGSIHNCWPSRLRCICQRVMAAWPLWKPMRVQEPGGSSRSRVAAASVVSPCPAIRMRWPCCRSISFDRVAPARVRYWFQVSDPGA